jgi:glycerate kinase
MRVVFAPDSFKGTVDAADAAAALRRGWLSVRPEDITVALPMADGGEGTLNVVASCVSGADEQRVRVLGPQGAMEAPWLLCPDGTAVVELALACGLPLVTPADPLGAHTFAFGQLLAAAASDSRVDRIVAAVGGSASTDGGAGALAALGARFVDATGHALPMGGGHLVALDRIDTGRMIDPPNGGVEVLVDVDAPLLGPRGAAAQFAPQKGADADQIVVLEQGLRRVAEVAGHPVSEPGAGAAGGTAYGLIALWGARTTAGALAVGRLTGLAAAIEQADVVVTGEGRLDRQSFQGKVVGHVTRVANRFGTAVWACVGQQSDPAPELDAVVTLTELAGSAVAAVSAPVAWLEAAGSALAARAHGTTSP